MFKTLIVVIPLAFMAKLGVGVFSMRSAEKEPYCFHVDEQKLCISMHLAENQRVSYTGYATVVLKITGHKDFGDATIFVQRTESARDNPGAAFIRSGKRRESLNFREESEDFLVYEQLTGRSRKDFIFPPKNLNNPFVFTPKYDHLNSLWGS